MEPEIVERIERLAEAKGRYRPEAYFWLLKALDFTRRRLQRSGHVSGGELLEGARLLTLEEYGPMAYDVLRYWGLSTTRDIGQLVFDLVDEGLLSKTEQDSIEDFAGGYDFQEAFVKGYPWQ